jgi:hypothetical protein
MQFREDNSGGVSSESFLKLKDKDTVTGVFRGEPYDFMQHWVGNRSTPCTEDKSCPHCKDGNKPSFRFRINFIVKAEGAYKAMIFEQGWTVYTDLRALNKDYSLEKYAMKITRSGTTKNDTKYTILPVPKGELNDAALKALAGVTLNDLQGTSTVGDTGFIPTGPSSDETFSNATIEKLNSAMKNAELSAPDQGMDDLPF